jgi:hypothetical protein
MNANKCPNCGVHLAPGISEGLCPHCQIDLNRSMPGRTAFPAPPHGGPRQRRPRSLWQHLAEWAAHNQNTAGLAVGVTLGLVLLFAWWMVTRTRGSPPAIARLSKPQPARIVPQEGRAPTNSDHVSWTVPPRDPTARPELIDLSSYYNGPITQGWVPPLTPERVAGNCLLGLKPGLQVLGGVQFDVRALVQLAGLGLRERVEAFPEQVNGIKVGQLCRRLHFLHAAAWTEPPGVEVGRYLLHGKGGNLQVIPIRYGEEVRNWSALNDTVPNSGHCRIVWTGLNLQGTVRLFMTTWNNPNPEVAIESLDFVSAMTTCAPFLLAITVE